MKKAKKVLLLVLCAALLVGASVAGTVAYLTDTDNVVNNTFTVGKVVITLDEVKVDAYGVPVADADRVTANKYKLIPGHTYTKDPTIHIDAESESCYLFVKIENGINATLAGQTGWTQIEGTNFWKYENIVAPGGNVVVFNSFTYSTDVEDTSADADKAIKVTAYAIQADGFDSVEAAWDASGFSTM